MIINGCKKTKSKLFEEAKVVFSKLPYVFYSPAQHGEAFNAHAPSVAGIVFGINAAVFEDFGVHHAGAENF